METLPENVTDYTDSSESESGSEYEKVVREDETSIPESEVYYVPTDDYTFRIDSVDASLRSSFSGLDYSTLENVWTINFNGGSYKVLFPKTEDLVIVDSCLVNIGTSNITGVILGDSLSLNTYFQRTFTVLPLMSSNSQNTAYRYGAHSYMSVYSQNNGTTLSVQQTYGDASVSSRGKFGSSWSSVNVIIIALLALQVLISFIGGLLRRG